MDGEDSLHLGGDIELTGFRGIDQASFLIVKKIVGNYVRKFGEDDAFAGLKLTLKSVHHDEGDPKKRYELHGQLAQDNRTLVAKEQDHNLFYVLDRTLKKLEAQWR